MIQAKVGVAGHDVYPMCMSLPDSWQGGMQGRRLQCGEGDGARAGVGERLQLPAGVIQYQCPPDCGKSSGIQRLMYCP